MLKWVIFRAVLFNEKENMWFDYNIATGKLSSEVYPSSVAPLYSECFHSDINMNLVYQSLQSNDLINQPGGLATSLLNSGQQWDMPNM